MRNVVLRREAIDGDIMPDTRTADFWRTRATEARDLAAAARSERLKRLLLEIAANYERLADIAAQGFASPE